MVERWDAIIVGASFAGLAAATELAGAGRVLLIDRLPVGTGETSACGTPLRVLERLDALDALEQVHPDVVVHLADGLTRRVTARYPFATFDYRRFCELLRARTDAQFLRASVTGITNRAVVTSRGAFTAPVIIDASGWRAVLGGRPLRVNRGRRWVSSGVEVRVPVTERGLHFWAYPAALRCGVGWLFPAGEHSRVGVACYRGQGGLAATLRRFAGLPEPATAMHGGMLPSRLGAPVAGGVLFVGDAAGQCLPLTGEGIRPALLFGQLAGRLGGSVLTGQLTPGQALSQYQAAVRSRRHYYRALRLWQQALQHAPPTLVAAAVHTVGGSWVAGPAQDAYWRLADPDLLRPAGLGA